MYSRQADEPEHLLTASANLFIGHPHLLEQPIADVVGDGERIEERRFLEEHADIPANLQHLLFRHVVDALPPDPDHARIGFQQAENQLQHHGFPGTARSQKKQRASGRDGKAHVVENDVVVEGERYVFEGDRGLWPSWFSVYREHLVLGPALRRERAQLSMSPEGN